jgi:MerR family transcriptional regulator, light-induced transcriptional regulator
MGRFTLNDLENITGIKADTIRIWERRYKILSPNRTSTNRRWYDDDDLAKLINISVLNQNGIKISKIASMSDSEINDTVSSFSEEKQGEGTHFTSLVNAINTFDENAINNIILKSVIKLGFEETFTKVLFPFLHKVGVMWHTGSLNPATEHFISCILRRQLITASDALPYSDTVHSKKCLLFLPEGEFHELGLLFYSFILQKRGNKVLYLGQSTPFDSVVKAVADWSPDLIITGILSELNMDNPAGYLKQLSSATKGTKILVSGMLSGIALELKLPDILPLVSEEDLLKV